MSDSVFGIQHKRLRESFAQGHKVSVKVKDYLSSFLTPNHPTLYLFSN